MTGLWREDSVLWKHSVHTPSLPPFPCLPIIRCSGMLAPEHGSIITANVKNIVATSVMHQRPGLIPSAHHGSGRDESPLAKFVISAVGQWLFEFAMGHTIEVAKIVKQTQHISYVGIFKQLTAQKGLVGLLDGFFPWGSLQALVKGSVFGWAHAFSRNHLDTLGVSPGNAEILSGAMAGGIQGVALNPVLLLKTRVVTDPKFRTSNLGMVATTIASTKAAGDIIRVEGPMALMKGGLWFSGKRAADWGSRFLFVVWTENIWKSSIKGNPDAKLSQTEQMIAALIGGSASAVATLPIDVVVANFQMASKAGVKMSFINVFKEQMAAQGGAVGFAKIATRGLVARVTHVALTTALMKTVSSAIYSLWKGH